MCSNTGKNKDACISISRLEPHRYFKQTTKQTYYSAETDQGTLPYLRWNS